MQDDHLQGIAALLVHEKLLDKEGALYHYQQALNDTVRFPYYLIFHNLIDSKVLATTTAKHSHLPLMELDEIDLESIPLMLLTEELIQRHQVIPICQHHNQLSLATDDPYKQLSWNEIQFYTGLCLKLFIVETDKLQRLIDTCLRHKEQHGLSAYCDGTIHQKVSHPAQDESPVVKFVNEILTTAMTKKISDIHFEPYEQTYRIRYRQDGLLHEIAHPPKPLANQITSRIKIMAQLDIAEKRLPQDGRFKMQAPEHSTIDVRVSTCPTLAGEKIVMRLLDTEATSLAIENLGLDLNQKQHFLTAIRQPQGMILVTGPTGSGKTVTLYSALNYLNRIEKNICTAEDPVEIKIPGINQVNINTKTGLTFATCLRAFLRQDPDIIMIGEIRDKETAEIAVKAAQTGHLVLSTLHTNSAVATLNRLANMGIPFFNIADSIRLILAQRLVRRLCPLCKQQNHHGYYTPQGCKHCLNGYSGRLGLFEVMPITKEMEQIILLEGASKALLQQAQKQGMQLMYQSGLERVRQGLTSLQEIHRVLGEENEP
jgi:type IV pilus assembly protein PilB